MYQEGGEFHNMSRVCIVSNLTKKKQSKTSINEIAKEQKMFSSYWKYLHWRQQDGYLMGKKYAMHTLGMCLCLSCLSTGALLIMLNVYCKCSRVHVFSESSNTNVFWPNSWRA